MKGLPYFLLLYLSFTACSSETQWVFEREIKLASDIQPVGLAVDNQNIWLSDVKNNRVVMTDQEGKIIDEYDGFQRPMHIDMEEGNIFVPDYITDSIKTISKKQVGTFALLEKPDAPGSIAKNGGTVAVADFYNHRIILQNEQNVSFLGKEGHGAGELYYPTDVAIYNNKIYVADAYNNRVQVFDRDGKFLQVLGENDNIKVATGIAVSQDNIYVTDFEGNRILIYDLEGELIQILTDHLNMPTDIFISGNNLYIANFGGNNVLVYKVEHE